ncbi:MAG: hypothetical protein M0P59_07420 [Gallionella sp.]|jgi:hypothetical protein|nr:hypothetical protein [Gallionella sp.]MCK9353974.1 hypothetical protein [Gallionella sp.]
MERPSNFAPVGKRHLAWPLALSLILHAIVLSQMNWGRMTAPASDRHPLTVTLEPFPLAREETRSRDNAPHPTRTNIEDAVDIKSKPEKISSPAHGIETPAAENTSAPAAHLDMNRLLNQARDYANKELRTSAPAFTLNGDYYGTYSGSDNGTFYVHLDNAGHASGSGQSGSFGISFIITGEATSDGLIQMSGSGIAGNARFKGQLDIKTGKLSGTWLAAGIGSGSFAGQHE